MGTPESSIPASFTEQVSANSHWAGNILLTRSDFRFLDESAGYREPESFEREVMYTGFLTIPWWDNDKVVQTPITMRITDLDDDEYAKICITLPFSIPSKYSDIDRFHHEATAEWKQWVEELAAKGHDVDWSVDLENTYGERVNAEIDWADDIPCLTFSLEESHTIEEDFDEDVAPVLFLSELNRLETFHAIIDAASRTWRSAYDFIDFFERERAPALFAQLQRIESQPLTKTVNAFIDHPLVIQVNGTWETPPKGVIPDHCRALGWMQIGNSLVESSLTQIFYGKQQERQMANFDLWYVHTVFPDWDSAETFIKQHEASWKKTLLSIQLFPNIESRWKYTIGRAEKEYRLSFDSASNQSIYMIGFQLNLTDSDFTTLYSQGWNDTKIVDAILTFCSNTFPETINL